MFKNRRQLELDLQGGKEELRGVKVLRGGLAGMWGRASLRGETKYYLGVLSGVVF